MAQPAHAQTDAPVRWTGPAGKARAPWMLTPKPTQLGTVLLSPCTSTPIHTPAGHAGRELMRGQSDWLRGGLRLAGPARICHLLFNAGSPRQ